MAAQQQRPCPSRVTFRRSHLPFGSLGLLHHTDSKPNFSGTWVKDKKASDSMDYAISIMGLSGLMRQAIKLIRGIKLTQDDSTFTMAVFSVFSWFKVTEKYTLDGKESKCRRRDFRRGGHIGKAHLSKDKLVLDLKWNDPFGGTGTDEFVMPSPDTLHVTSSITVDGKTAKYTQVYNRKS